MTLKEGKKTGISYQNDGGTAFDFGCNDFYLYQEKVFGLEGICCFEWKGDIPLKAGECLGGDGYMAIPQEIEVHELR